MAKTNSKMFNLFFKLGKSSPVKISLLYLFIGSAWIWFSDQHLHLATSNLQQFFEISVIKGFLFIFFTSALLYFLISFQNKEILQQHNVIGETEKRYMLLFESNPIPMWVYDLQTFKFILVNNAAVETYGYSKEEFLSMNIFDIRPKEDHKLLNEDLKKDQNIRYTFSGKWRHKRKNGEIFFVEINSHPIIYKDRKAKLVMASDITKRVETEEEIKAVVSELNNFVYRASHDIRGPLARLIGLSNLAKIDKSGQVSQYNHLIYSTALLLDNILQRLLSVNTLKEYTPEFENINLYELVEEIILFVKANNNPFKAEFKNEIEKDFIVYSDRKILLLTLENIIENSALYCSPTNDKDVLIKVSISVEEKIYRIFIEDNGIGIPEEIKGRIFDMFYRGTELSKGSGLGLYIAKSAMKKIQGDVIFNSRVKNETIFEISFPKNNDYLRH